MPEQQLQQANPPPEPSQLPSSLAELAIRIDYKGKNALSPSELHAIQLYRRCGNYLAACMHTKLSFFS